MKGILPLFLGIFGTFAFSWAGLVLIPNAQIGHLDPQMDEDGNDPYPAPKSGMADRGRKIYAANGCVYCHSQQVRADYAASDLERKWGDRRSAPRDYLFERPALLGKMRMGPDLANVGKRAPADDQNAPPPSATNATSPAAPSTSPAAPAAPGTSPGTSPAAPAASPAASATTSPAVAAAPAISPAASPTKKETAATAPASPAPATSPAAPAPSPASPPANAATTADATVSPNGAPLPYSAAWHHRHLYNPRSVTLDSNMPAYHFLYEKKLISGQRSADALTLAEGDALPAGWEIVPTYDAKCLVAYLMSLDQSHALKEVKSTAPSSPPAPAKEVK
ncbi:MAG: cytochrome c oxidase cbb3-type subunit [Verrucomicrobiota bacterium]|jgi:cytochrome c oxidase cbb3-type subunit 2